MALGHLSTTLLTTLAVVLSPLVQGCGDVASVTQGGELGAMDPVALPEASLTPVLVDTPYKEVIPVEGGSSPFTFALLGGELPPGLEVAEATGVISGQVARTEIKKTASFTVQVTDAIGATAEQSYTLTVNEYGFAIVPETIDNLVPGVPFALALGTIGASKPVKFSTSGTLPPGLTIDETGKMATGPDGVGIEQQSTKWSFDAIATDANGVVVSRSYELKLGEYLGRAPLALQTESLPAPTATADYSTGLVVTGGVVPYKFALTTGELPPGMTLDTETGALAGIMDAAGAGKAYTFSVTVTDAKGTEATRSYSVVVSPYDFTVEPEVMPLVTPGVPFSMTFSAPGSQPVVKFSASGNLPPGLTLTDAGVLSTDADGIPQAHENSNWSFRVLATDGNGIVKGRDYTLTLGEFLGKTELVIVTDNIATPSAGVVYSSGIGIAGGTAPYTLSVVAGALPSGLTLGAASGLISGTVAFGAANTPYDFTIKVVDLEGIERTKRYQGLVGAGNALLTIHTATLVNPTAGNGYSAAIAVTGGSTPYAFSVTSGSLPAGLTLGAATGLLSGTVNFAAGGQNFYFEVTVQDANAQSATKAYSGTIQTGIGSLIIETATIPTVYAGNSYTSIITASGGKSPYTFVIESGGLVPGGLTLASATGILSGSVPSSAANDPFVFTVRVTDDIGQTQTKTYSGNVSAYVTSIVPTSMPAGDPSQSYGVTLTTVGGQSAYTYALTAGSLPSGLSLNTTTGQITGTIAPAEAGQTRNFTITSTDANGITSARAYSLTVSGFVVAVTTSSLATSYEGVAYSATLAATGGTGPYTYEYTGALPTGIGMTNLGALFGTPATNQGSTAGTTYPIAVRAKDAAGRYSVSTALTVTVGLTAPSIANVTPGTATLGSTYSHTVTATGGRGPYAFTLDSGSLPTGLSLATSGVISGTATQTAACPAAGFVVKVTDSSTPAPQTATRTLCVTAVNGLVFNNASLPTVVRGAVYSTTMSVTGGTAPYTYTGASLPSGLTMTTGGILSGSSSAAAGSHTIYVSASDSSGLSTTRPFVLTIADPLTLQAVTFQKGGSGKSYGPVTLTALGGVSPYSFSLASGSLPPGVNLTSGGVISGTISQSAAVDSPYTFAIGITDSSGLSYASSNFSIAVSVSPTFRSTRLDSTVSGANVENPIRFSGGVPPFTFAATGLPTGLSVNASSGIVSGSTLSTGNFSPNFTITDANGIATSKVLPLTVSATAKTLNFKANKFVEPCPQSPTLNCDPRAYKTGMLVAATPAVRYLVYGANLNTLGTWTTPTPRIYVARIDSRGRIATPGTSVTNVALTIAGYPTAIDLADLDLDGHLDIVFADYTNAVMTVLWNSGTTDGNGMPTFPTSNNFAMPGGSTKPNLLQLGHLRNGANAAKWDLVAIDWNFNNPNTIGRVAVWLGACAVAPCTRASIFGAATAYTTTLVNGQGLRDLNGLQLGNFHSTTCKDIAVAGRQQAGGNNDWMFIRRQDISGGVCQGTFNTTAEQMITTAASNYIPADLTSADFNNDGFSDLAAVLGSNASARVVVMGAAGGFTGATLYAPTLPAVGGNIGPYCLNGDASCAYPSLVVAGGRRLHYLPIQAQVATSYLSVLPNSAGEFDNGSGATRIDYVGPPGAGQDLIIQPLVSTGGKVDVAYIGYENNSFPYYVVYENNGGSTTDPFKSMKVLKSLPDDFANFAEVGTMTMADLNGDGYQDLISHLINQQAIAVHLGPLAQNYSIAPTFYSAGVQHGLGLITPGYQQKSLVGGDFDSDGNEDVALVGAQSRAVGVMLGDGTGAFSTPTLSNTGDGDTRPYAVQTGDLNADGILDLVMVNINAVGNIPSISWLRGHGDGTFDNFVDIANGTSAVGCADPRSIVVEDLDDDAKPELLVVCYTNAQVVVFRRHTDGVWKKNNGTIAVGGTNGTAVAVGRLTAGDACYALGADFVSRPCVDVVITQYNVGATIRLLANFTLGTPAGNGTFNVQFTNNNTVNMYGYAHDVAISDLDLDGVQDIAVSMYSQNTATTGAGQIVYACKGSGVAGSPCLSFEGYAMEQPLMHGIVIGDYNNDAKPDIVTSSRTGQRIQYLMIGRMTNDSQ